MSNNLPISRLINVQVSLQATAAQAQNVSTLMIVGTSPIIDLSTRARLYTSINQVATDFGTTAPEYFAAALWFEQAPQPSNLYIGRWAANAAAGQLLCGSLSAGNQALSNFTSVTNGGFTVTIDGTVQHITGLNFSAAANLNAVASDIQAGMSGVTVIWDAVYSRFEFTSHTTGATSGVSALSAPTAGTNISATLNGIAGTSGLLVVPGQLAESALTAVSILDSQLGQSFYGITVISAADADHLAIAAYVESASTYHYYGVSTQEAGTLVPGNTSTIAYELSQANYTRTAVQYSSTSPYAVCSLLGRILTVDYTGNNTTIDLFYKQEPGIVPENLNATQINAAEAVNCNVFVAYQNNTAIIEPGNSCSGDPIDTIIGAASFAITAQTSLYNLLYTSPTKIPQTDAGMHVLVTNVESVCSQFAANGLFGANLTWTGPGLGAIATGATLPDGYYVYAAPVATQAQAPRAARISVPIQVIATLAGAVRTVNLAVTINS